MSGAEPLSTALPFSVSGVGDCWKPAGSKIRIQQHTIDGLLYVGSDLSALSGHGTEPALVIPELPAISKPLDLSVRRTDYWPSYKTSTPEARGAYLQWLAGGKKDPKADIGLVFLYFYGLERRTLADPLLGTVSEDELQLIAHEVRRLLGIYAHPSFERYARALLDILDARNAPAELYRKSLPDIRHFGLLHKIALAQCAMDKVPLPLHWALAWLELDGEFALPSAARRCRREFRELFSIRYRERFGKGLTLNAGHSSLVVRYQPASSSFNGLHHFIGFKSSYPNVSALSASAAKLYDLAHECCQALAGYARSMAKSTSGEAGADPHFELPYVLWPQTHKNLIEKLYIEVKKKDRPLTLSAEALKERLGEHLSFGKAQWRNLSERLSEAGIGVEPSATVMGQLPSTSAYVSLFIPQNLADLHAPPSYEYLQGAIAAQLVAAMLHVDTGKSIDALWVLDRLQSTFNLSSQETPRLAAHLYRILAEGPKTSGVKAQASELGEEERIKIGEFLILISQRRGTLTEPRRKALEDAFKALSLPFSMLPEVPPPAPDEPALVASAEQVEDSYPIRPPAPVLSLDRTRIAQLEKETHQVASLLAGIFTAEPESSLPALTPPNEETESSSRLWNLDEEHSAFARALSHKASWTREELQALAETSGMMLDGALETVNEACLEATGDPFIEGTDPIDVYCDLVKEPL